MQCRYTFLYVLTFPLLLALPLPRPTTTPLATTAAKNLALYTQLLSDELVCDFDNITYCGLHNNGGWSFKQSLLELVQQLTKANASAYLQPRVHNYFVCSDWGVMGQPSIPSSSLPSLSGSSERVATLELFFLPPSPSPLRQSSGRIFYAEEGRVEPDLSMEEARVGEETEEEINPDLGICIEMDARLSSEHSDGSSKLSVKFRSTSQTIEALPQPPPPPPLQPPSTPLSSVFGSLASWIFRGSSSIPTYRNHTHRTTPPLDTWTHLILPLDTQHLPEWPLYFALDGHAGACVDSLQVTRCPASTTPSLSWPPNHTLSLVRSAPPILLLPPPHSDSASSFYATFRHLFTKAFFFACLLIILIALLVIIFVASVACGRTRGTKMRTSRSVKKGGGGSVPPISRSPSISSLPIDEIWHCDEEDSLKEWDELGVNDERHNNPSLDTRRELLKRPHRRRGGRPRHTQSIDRRLLTDDRFSPSAAARQQPPRRGKRPLSVQKHRRERRWQSMNGEPTVEVVPRNAGQRLSLLLAINEDNELVLVPPASSTASTGRNGARNSSISPSDTTKDSSGAATITTAYSGVNTTSTTTATTTSVNASVDTTGVVASFTSSGRLPTAEAEATLQEMAASVAHLGSRAGTETCSAASSSSSSSSSTIASSDAEEPPLCTEAVQMLSEQ